MDDDKSIHLDLRLVRFGVDFGSHLVQYRQSARSARRA
jgi:hypothetical protein